MPPSFPPLLPPAPPVDLESLQALLSGADQATRAARWRDPDPAEPRPASSPCTSGERRSSARRSRVRRARSRTSSPFELEPETLGVTAQRRRGGRQLRPGHESTASTGSPSLPLSLRLIREIHAELLAARAGRDRMPGEFRTTQNWIGPEVARSRQATFVPPPPEMQAALENLERSCHYERVAPVLIHCGLAHAQFETIHPFLDGNGRVGRLLITFLLVHRGVLERPLLYLSLLPQAAPRRVLRPADGRPRGRRLGGLAPLLPHRCRPTSRASHGHRPRHRRAPRIPPATGAGVRAGRTGCACSSCSTSAR